MSYLTNYLDRFRRAGREEVADSILKTSEYIGNSYLRSMNVSTSLVGLLFGNIQSGKTGQLFGIACEAADLGFPYFVLLTTDNRLLQQQTYERALRDLSDFAVCDESEEEKFRSTHDKPVMIVLKKNRNVLSQWGNIIKNSQALKGNQLFIIDDEGDAASLNTKVNSTKANSTKAKNEAVSAINSLLENIKNSASSSVYLEVTGTPQSLFLQSYESWLKPAFAYYFEPGSGYLGGDFFFPQQKVPEFVHFVDGEAPLETAKSVVLRHFVVSAQVLLSGETVSNCLVHPGVKQISHRKYKDEIEKAIIWWTFNHDEILEDGIKKYYFEMNPQKSSKQSLEAITEKVQAMLENKDYNMVVLNNKSADGHEDYRTGCNFIFGGTSLGRGVTFEQLNTFYYMRTSKRPQADTMWQHSRMFGYDRDPGLISVYSSHELYKLFAEINETNNSIIAQMQNGNNVTISYPNGLKPTRDNVLDMSLLNIVAGGVNHFPSSPKNATFEEVSELLKEYDGTASPSDVGLKFMKEILTHITADDMDISAYIKMIESERSKNPVAQGKILVRRDRDIRKNSGALLSSDDWNETNKFKDQFVLTMYQVKGEKSKGWDGHPVWVPNIKLPVSNNFYLI